MLLSKGEARDGQTKRVSDRTIRLGTQAFAEQNMKKIWVIGASILLIMMMYFFWAQPFNKFPRGETNQPYSILYAQVQWWPNVGEPFKVSLRQFTWDPASAEHEDREIASSFVIPDQFYGIQLSRDGAKSVWVDTYCSGGELLDICLGKLLHAIKLNNKTILSSENEIPLHKSFAWSPDDRFLAFGLVYGVPYGIPLTRQSLIKVSNFTSSIVAVNTSGWPHLITIFEEDNAYVFPISWSSSAAPPARQRVPGEPENRDLFRIAELVQIKAFLALYYHDHGRYPSSIDELNPAYTKEIFFDPKFRKAFEYQVGQGGQQYKLCAQFETDRVAPPAGHHCYDVRNNLAETSPSETDYLRKVNLEYADYDLGTYYIQHCGIYPLAGRSGVVPLEQLAPFLVPAYENQVPNDPTLADQYPYRYWVSSDGKHYALYAHLENAADTDIITKQQDPNLPEGYNYRVTEHTVRKSIFPGANDNLHPTTLPWQSPCPKK